jgi:hypothetical protein
MIQYYKQGIFGQYNYFLNIVKDGYYTGYFCCIEHRDGDIKIDYEYVKSNREIYTHAYNEGWELLVSPEEILKIETALMLYELGK